MELSPIVNIEQIQSESEAKQPTRRPLIHVFTGFRALACLWIFMFHSTLNKMDEIVKFHIEWVSWSGAAGVTLFFCLSGFVMVWTYGDCEFKSTKCYWSFIGRRAARLFPLYYFSLLLSIYDIRCVWVKDKSCTREYFILIVSTLLPVRTWIPYRLDFEKWNAAIWSVQTEWFLYLVFPFLLRLIRYLLNTTKISLLSNVNNKTKALIRLYFMWFIVLCISTIPFLFRFTILDHITNTAYQFTSTSIIYVSPLTRIFEFTLGILTGIIFTLKSPLDNQMNQSDMNIVITSLSNDKQQQKNVSSSTSVSHTNNSHLKYNCHCFMFDIYFLLGLLFFIFICAPLLFNEPMFYGYSSLICMGPLISLIMCTYLYFSAKYSLSLTSRLLTTSLLINMGEISYAFYCLVDTLPTIFLLISGKNEDSVIMKLFAGIGIAVFARHYIEMPFYTWANRKLPKCQCQCQ
ncbi:unnamed protein product [Adineta steineri]|uniref:Acyltransferase 3 domain-containing protein n=1 Tax=Adineta steineri TaxID=433720 RepID=A0A815QQ81_9BILA|nr:unnamed protein product [Adineta steineri]